MGPWLPRKNNFKIPYTQDAMLETPHLIARQNRASWLGESWFACGKIGRIRDGLELEGQGERGEGKGEYKLVDVLWIILFDSPSP